MLLLSAATPAWAQKNKDKKKQQEQTDSSSDAKAMPPMNDTQAVDLASGRPGLLADWRC